MSESQLRVLIVTGSYPPMMCGVGDYTCALVNSLRAQGVDVRVLTSELKKDIPVKENEFWIRRVMKIWRLNAYLTFIKELEDFQPDIVHIQDPTQGYHFMMAPISIVLRAFIIKKMSIVWTWHEFPPPINHRRFMMFIAMSIMAKAIIVVRHNYKQRLSKLISCLLLGKPFEFIPNASVIPKVDLDFQEIANLRKTIPHGDKKIIVFFGFIYPNKGIERLFEIADPAKHHIILIGKFDGNYEYHQKILAISKNPDWSNNVTFLGFLSPENVAKYIRSADAVVLPYLEGAGSWNTSLHAAMLQGSFVLTTSLSQIGYDNENNIFYAAPDDIPSMREALLQYCGVRKDVKAIEDPWTKIAIDHIKLYNQILLTRK